MTGALTSSGERLHHDSMTCAHRTYPFGTRLKVTNTANGKIVFVRVTDRGPYRRGRIIDLSWGAAKALGILTQGVAMVMVEPVDTTIIPFRPSGNMGMPELEFESFELFEGIRPDWEEFKEINHKAPVAIPKKAARPQNVKPSAGHSSKSAGTSDRQGGKPDAAGGKVQAKPSASSAKSSAAAAGQKTSDKATSKPKDNGGNSDIDEINSKPNTSRVYSKRQGGK